MPVRQSWRSAAVINKRTDESRKEEEAVASGIDECWVGGDPLLGNGRQARQEVNNKDEVQEP